MTNIKLKDLTLTNFKCYATAKFKFDEHKSQIKGPTGYGKTTIKDAYLWALGIDKEFAPKVDDQLIKDIETSVECVLEVNGVDYTLKRINKQKWKYNEDKGIDEFAGNESKFMFDGEPTGVKVYKEQIGKLYDVIDYPIVADLQTFNVDWEWKRRRTLLFNLFNIEDKVLKLLDNENFASIKDELSKGKDETQVADIIKTEKKAIADKLKDIKVIIQDKTNELAELNKINFAFYESEKARLEDDINDLQKQQIQQELDTKNQVAELERNISNIKLQIERETDNAEALERASENVFMNELADTCPTCGRKFDEKHILTLKAKLELDKMAKMTELKDQAENCRLNARNLQEQLNTLENELQAQKAYSAPREGHIQSNEEYLKAYNDIKYQLDNVNRELFKRTLITELKSKIEELKKENRVLLNKQTDCLRKQSALKEYIKQKIELVNHEINKHFDGITFKFFKFNTANADNEYSPTCECMLNGVTYSNLSQGQRIIADFETNKGLQKILEVNVPQFIDNKQDNTFPMESDCQIIELITCEDTNINAEFIKKENN